MATATYGYRYLWLPTYYLSGVALIYWYVIMLSDKLESPASGEAFLFFVLSVALAVAVSVSVALTVVLAVAVAVALALAHAHDI
jgi:hypothetical protein